MAEGKYIGLLRDHPEDNSPRAAHWVPLANVNPQVFEDHTDLLESILAKEVKVEVVKFEDK
jgi:hypothetical protein